MWSFFSRDPSKDFNYEIVELVSGLETKSVWSQHKGKKRGTNEEVSVFVYDIKTGSDAQLELAKSAIKRLKTLRHPSVLTFLDSLETDKNLYLATEYVEPLAPHLEKLTLETPQKELYIAWGIFQITRALSFLNNDGNLRHHNVNIWSVFVNTSGEWKLGGVEYVSNVQDNHVTVCKVTHSLEVYDPPEKHDPTKQRLITKCSSDMWGLGCLIWEIFNGPLYQKKNLENLEKVPKQLITLYSELVSPNPSARPNPADIITRCRKLGGYFKNDLVDTLLFLEEIQIKDKNEKNRFFSNLTPHLDNFPDSVCKHKILPQLITAFEYGDAGSAVLAPMFKLGKLLEETEYQRKIVPCVVKLFGSNDRATRSRLLQQLEHFIGHLQASTVNDQIFPQIAHGFMDTNPTIREQTVKSVIHLAPKLSYNHLNVEVLRHFARLQAKDDQGGIRTNTTVCLGKIAQHLHPQIRQKVLISAFTRAMRDPFPPARNASVLALAATQQYYLLVEVSQRILPALCQLTLDPEKSVRDSVFRTIKGFLGKLEKVSEDPSLKESMEADVNTATPSLGNAAATWAGWAVTAVTAKFYRSQSETVKSVNTIASRMLNKPASLEQPSSSSISTTTSSVTSMTSLEHEEGSRGNESVSDYDYDHWGDNENWGDMETEGQMASSSGSPGITGTHSDPTSPPSGSGAKVTDGWDNEEWGSLEEEPEAEAEMTSPSDAWSPIEQNKANNVQKPEIYSNWEETEFEPLQDQTNVSSQRLEEAKKRREEKKLIKQKELEARRANRATAGPMKLGAKKL
ncbi:N-terminal kinase-like protein [Cylas formicarius]|uniref:N-terminal kinase-like protein n=1 Tax=Cylas formicarius TaxID=197179 RepID=UPI00295854E9|nr:N-terminal kinase-like protein [Cylas formicarius]